MRHINKYKKYKIIQNKHKIIIQDIRNKKRPKTLSNSQDSMGQVTRDQGEPESGEQPRNRPVAAPPPPD